MVSDKHIRWGGASLAIGLGLAVVLAIISLVAQMTALVVSETLIGQAPGSGYLDEVMSIVDSQAALLQSMWLTRAVSAILTLWGIVILERALRDDTAGGFLRGFAVLAAIISITMVIAALGFDLVSAHALELGGASGSESDMAFAESRAETLKLGASSLSLMASMFGLLSSSALHFGLASRSMFRHSSRISLVVGIVSVLTLLLLVFANYISEAVIQAYVVASILGMVPRLWLLFVGIMMYRKGDGILGDG